MAAEDRLSRVDILLMLLLAGGTNNTENEPIVGKTRLQKELFLAQKVLKDHHISRPYSFRPYHYGPFCKDVYNDIEWLKSEGLVEEKREESVAGIVRVFRLTQSGLDQTRDLIRLQDLEDSFRLIRGIKKEYNSMSVIDLVELTHREYPEYVGSD